MTSASAMTAPTTYQNFIGGEWRDSASGTTFLDTNPARDSDVIGAFQRSNVEDLDAAIIAAQKAFPAWRATPAPARGVVAGRTPRGIVEAADARNGQGAERSAWRSANGHRFRQIRCGCRAQG